MRNALKIALFGFLIWLIAFVVSILIFPLREAQRPLFESIMPVVIASGTVLFAILYFRNVNADFLRAGVLLGVVWLLVNIVIDLLLFLPESPMQMTFADYMMDIGVTYLIIPAITIGFGFLLQRKAT